VPEEARKPLLFLDVEGVHLEAHGDLLAGRRHEGAGPSGRGRRCGQGEDRTAGPDVWSHGRHYAKEWTDG